MLRLLNYNNIHTYLYFDFKKHESVRIVNQLDLCICDRFDELTGLNLQSVTDAWKPWQHDLAKMAILFWF